nr:hypothetical protein [Bartonella henselae]
MRLIRKVMLMCVLISLTGCVTNEPVSCIGWLPIYLDRQDVSMISQNLARDILKHNKQGERLCGWRNDKKTKVSRESSHQNRTIAASRDD